MIRQMPAFALYARARKKDKHVAADRGRPAGDLAQLSQQYLRFESSDFDGTKYNKKVMSRLKVGHHLW